MNKYIMETYVMEIMWQNKVGTMTAETFFDHEKMKFLVRVSDSKTNKKLEECFPALFAPLFGMDLQDSEISLSIAEELALKLETI